MPALSTLARQEYYSELGNALPPPVLPQPEYRQRRHTTAVEAFEALHPADAYEARLAVQIVLAGAHAAESLREAGAFREDFSKRNRCRAQAASLMREERAAKRALAQEQKVRLAVEAVANGATARPAASAPLPQAEPQTAPRPVQVAAVVSPPVQAAAAAPLPAPGPAPVAAPVPVHAPPPLQAAAAPQAAAALQAAPSALPSPEAIAKAKAFADDDVVAAAQIRHDRGVTPRNKVYLRHLELPTDPEVIDALVRGTSDLLTLLDEVGGEDLSKAA